QSVGHQSIDRQQLERGISRFAIGAQYTIKQALRCFQNFGGCWIWIVVERIPHRSRKLLRRRRALLAHAVGARCFRILSGASATTDAMRAASGIPAWAMCGLPPPFP